ncbi:hypothetical protein GQ43DRAFT_439136 [Delitschia confertaspora ATCC 74209]|uniref:Sin3 associated polypeptide p18 n=1 Tax=Delitschia confertaspora ATCC 74209 TaxID=1513339 RepID=A0A9P4JTS5_9PLEO|nr:hypothetical protein GQ43DRAFT_439136 [Delitschia confertaspora ATCC 74209]
MASRPAPQAPTTAINRQLTTPFLLRLFYKTGAFHRIEEFTPGQRLPPHIQIYTWQNCTLRELSHLLLTALPNLLPTPAIGSRVAFRMVYADTRDRGDGALPRFTTRDLGSVIVAAPSNPNASADRNPAAMDLDERGPHTAATVRNALKDLAGEPDKTLANGRFVIGDYISCAIFPPLADGSVPSAPAGATSSVRREAGYGPPRGGYGSGLRENGYGRGDFGGYGGRGGRGGGRFDGRDQGYGGFGRGSGLPSGEWRRGEAPPGDRGGYWRGSSGGRGRGRGSW